MHPSELNNTILPALISEKMPFGKYKGRFYDQIPVSYLEWMYKKGFPPGRTGMLLHTIYEIRLNGLDYLLKDLRKMT